MSCGLYIHVSNMDCKHLGTCNMWSLYMYMYTGSLYVQVVFRTGGLYVQVVFMYRWSLCTCGL